MNKPEHHKQEPNHDNSKEQTSVFSKPFYWIFMLIALGFYLNSKYGCSDGTFAARAKCRGVSAYEKAQCVECVKSGGTWKQNFLTGRGTCSK